jgi:hypothetical protein
MNVEQINLNLFQKWRKLPEDEKKKIARQVGVSKTNIDKFFLNQYSMTVNKWFELNHKL